MTLIASSTRRAVLKPLVALVATAAMPALGRAVEPADPDQALLDLGKVWRLSAVRNDMTRENLWEIERLYVAPAVPEALFRQAGDGQLFFGLSTAYCRDEGQWYGYLAAIEDMRGRSCNLRGPIRLEDDRVIPAVPDWPARRRRDEIVAAYERWEADCDAAEEACGLKAAVAADDAANEENRELRRRIMTMPALTIPGVMLKASVAGWCYSGSAEMTDTIGGYVKEGNLSGEAVAFCAVRDLVAMIERGPA